MISVMFYIALIFTAVVFVIVKPILFVVGMVVVNFVFVGIIVWLGASNWQPPGPPCLYDAQKAIAMVCFSVIMNLFAFFGYIFYSQLWFLFVPFVLIIIFLIQKSKKRFVFRVSGIPSQRACVIIWGKKFNLTVGPGVYVQFPYFPINLAYELLNMETRNNSFQMLVWLNDNKKASIRTKISYSIVWSLDPSRSDYYVDYGFDAGVIIQLSKLVETEVEKLTEDNDENWERFFQNRKEIKERMIDSLTGQKQISRDGLPDNKNLGIIIQNVMLEDLEPLDTDLTKAMVQRAIEERQQDSQKKQHQTDEISARKLVIESKGRINFREAYKMVVEKRQLDEKKVTKNITEIQGDSLTAAVMGIIQKVSGGKKP